MINDNPAQKLLDLLEELRLRQKEYCWDVWQDVLSIEKREDFPIAFAKITMLLEGIIEYLIVYEPDAEQDCQYLKSRFSQAMMGQDLSGEMHTFTTYFDEHVLKDLRNFSRIMRNHTIGKRLAKSDLEKILQEMQNLKNSVMAADNISERLQLSICKYINRIIHLVEQYKISSSEEILSAIEALAGHIGMDKEGREIFEDTDKHELKEKFNNALCMAANICTIAVTLNPQISQTVMKLLTP
ncbi:hypothetical protein [Eikenella sp. NML120348]|uniref:hypothetical protein n=1 Tax=Eikenella sp. NML120348 TaxID=1795831 RepID=UPI0007E16E23|nr:hypothetical protein [Eikenella sp. NML120348]OAM35922.1 hypothetical protein A7P99_08915 [Eikenella sp. NML120348]